MANAGNDGNDGLQTSRMVNVAAAEQLGATRTKTRTKTRTRDPPALFCSSTKLVGALFPVCGNLCFCFLNIHCHPLQQSKCAVCNWSCTDLNNNCGLESNLCVNIVLCIWVSFLFVIFAIYIFFLQK